MSELNTISGAKAKEVFKISNTTILAYEKKGFFRVLGRYSFEDTAFDYRHICNILGLKEIPNEPLLITEDAIKLLGISDNYSRGGIRKYCDTHKIPYYAFTNTKGSKTYFLRSELEAYMKYSVQWGFSFPDFVVRNYALREIFKLLLSTHICKSLKPDEANIISEVILGRKTTTEYAYDNNITTQAAATLFSRGAKRIFYAMRMLNINIERTAELTQENSKLIVENEILSDKLKIMSDANIPMRERNLSHLAKSFDENNLSVRVFGLMTSMEVKNLYDLSKWRRSDVLKFRNAGKKTMEALDDLLEQNGMSWTKEASKSMKNRKGKAYKSKLPDLKTKLSSFANE